MSEIFILPEILLGFLAILWFLFIPFGIGSLFVASTMKLTKGVSNYIENLDLVNLLIKWFIGLFLILLVTFAVNLLKITNWVGPILLVAVVVYFYFRKQPMSITETKFSYYKNIVKILVIASILGLSFGIYIRSFSPYPLTAGFDLFAHVHVAKSILNGSIDTGTVVYLPTFDMLIGLSSATFHVDPISVFWLGPLLLFSLFGLSSYGMSYWITKNHVCAFIGSFIGLSLTEQGLVPNLPHFYPGSFIMCLFPISIVIVDKLWAKVGQNKIFTVILTLIIFCGLILIHYELGLVASIILSLYLLILFSFSKKALLLTILKIITIIAGIVTFLYFWGYTDFQIQIQNLFNQSHMIDNAYLYNIPIKLLHLNQFYTPQVITFAILGFVASSFFVEKRAVVIGFIALVLLLIDFQQISIIDRILSIERPLLSFSAAVLLMMPSLIIIKRSSVPADSKNASSNSNNFSKQKKFNKFLSKLSIITLSNKSAKLSIAYGIVVSLLLIPILSNPYKIYLEPFFNHGDTFSNFNSEELTAAKWIEKNTPKNYLVFSDPFTTIEMRGLAFRENIEGIGWNLTVAKLVHNVMTSENATEAYNKIISNNGKNVMILITPRTSEWLKVNDFSSEANRENYFIDFPIPHFIPFTGLEKFFSSGYFHLVYRSDNVYLFTLTNGQTLVKS